MRARGLRLTWGDSEQCRIAVAHALSHLAAADLLRAACASSAWRCASERVEAWAGARLTLRHRAGSIAAEPDAADDSEVNSVTAMEDTFLVSFLRKMRRVGDRHGLALVPPPGGSGAPRHTLSPLHLRREQFGDGKATWHLCYNTEAFGWFDSEHTNVFPCGLKVWSPCPLMCRWFAQSADRAVRSVEGQRVLELGAGIGMLGFSLAASARHVVVTDIDPKVLRVVEANARINEISNVDVQQLAYGQTDAEAFRVRFGRFDHIVGADIIYGAKVIRPIMESVDELLVEDGTFSLGFVQRDAQFAPALEAMARELGFEQVHAPRWLARELGDLGPQEEKKPCGKGILAELQEMLRHIPDRANSFNEAAEKARLLEFRRCRVPEPQAFIEVLAIDLNAMD